MDSEFQDAVVGKRKAAEPISVSHRGQLCPLPIIPLKHRLVRRLHVQLGPQLKTQRGIQLAPTLGVQLRIRRFRPPTFLQTSRMKTEVFSALLVPLSVKRLVPFVDGNRIDNRCV